jgi:hypothetical protein
MAACMVLGLFAAVPAQASFHLMKIREVGGGTFPAGFNDSYVELQMYAPGQNLLTGHTLNFWSHNDTMPTSTTFTTSVPNGQNQATILIGDTSVSGSDATNMALSTMFAAGPGLGGGLICWENIDCVSIGTGPAAGVVPPSPTGAAAPFPFTDQAIRRSIAPGCPTLLEAADDTNSGADFSVTTPIPRNNAAPITEKACAPGVGVGGDPNTTIKKRPKNRSGDDSPTFKFKSDEPGSTFKCKLDHKKFHKCKSPKTYHGVAPGKHTFKVEAIDADGNVDPTPAKDKFTVLP